MPHVRRSLGAMVAALFGPKPKQGPSTDSLNEGHRQFRLTQAVAEARKRGLEARPEDDASLGWLASRYGVAPIDIRAALVAEVRAKGGPLLPPWVTDEQIQQRMEADARAEAAAMLAGRTVAEGSMDKRYAACPPFPPIETPSGSMPLDLSACAECGGEITRYEEVHELGCSLSAATGKLTAATVGTLPEAPAIVTATGGGPIAVPTGAAVDDSGFRPYVNVPRFERLDIAAQTRSSTFGHDPRDDAAVPADFPQVATPEGDRGPSPERCDGCSPSMCDGPQRCRKQWDATTTAFYGPSHTDDFKPSGIAAARAGLEDAGDKGTRHGLRIPAHLQVGVGHYDPEWQRKAMEASQTIVGAPPRPLGTLETEAQRRTRLLAEWEAHRAAAPMAAGRVPGEPMPRTEAELIGQAFLLLNRRGAGGLPAGEQLPHVDDMRLHFSMALTYCRLDRSPFYAEHDGNRLIRSIVRSAKGGEQ